MYSYGRLDYDHRYQQTFMRNRPAYTMTVEGAGQLTVRPDRAKITLGVVTENKDVLLAQQENTMISNRVIEALKGLGIEESSIRTAVYTVYPRYDYIEGKTILRGYEVEHLLEVIIKDLSIIGSVYQEAVQRGVNRSGGIQFIVSNQEGYYREALRVALINAREKAEAIAGAIPAVISQVPIKITEHGMHQERSPFLPQIAAATTQETPPIQTGDYTIQARVSVIYRYQ